MPTAATRRFARPLSAALIAAVAAGCGRETPRPLPAEPPPEALPQSEDAGGVVPPETAAAEITDDSAAPAPEETSSAVSDDAPETDSLSRLFAAWRDAPDEIRDAARRIAAAVAELAETHPGLLARSPVLVVETTDDSPEAFVAARARLVDAFAALARVVAALPDDATGLPDEAPTAAREAAATLAALLPPLSSATPVNANRVAFYRELELALGEACLASDAAEFDAALRAATDVAYSALDPPADPPRPTTVAMITFLARPTARTDAVDPETRATLIERVAVAVDDPTRAVVDAVVTPAGAVAVTCGPVADAETFRTRFEAQLGTSARPRWRIDGVEPAAP